MKLEIGKVYECNNTKGVCFGYKGNKALLLDSTSYVWFIPPIQYQYWALAYDQTHDIQLCQVNDKSDFNPIAPKQEETYDDLIIGSLWQGKVDPEEYVSVLENGFDGAVKLHFHRNDQERWMIRNSFTGNNGYKPVKMEKNEPSGSDFSNTKEPAILNDELFNDFIKKEWQPDKPREDVDISSITAQICGISSIKDKP